MDGPRGFCSAGPRPARAPASFCGASIAPDPVLHSGRPSTEETSPMPDATELMLRHIVVGVFEENCYVVGSRRTREAICIDPGDQPEEILALARDMGVEIKLIANSH